MDESLQESDLQLAKTLALDDHPVVVPAGQELLREVVGAKHTFRHRRLIEQRPSVQLERNDIEIDS